MSRIPTNSVGDLLQIISQDLRWKETIGIQTQATLGTANATTMNIHPPILNRKPTTLKRKSTTTTSSRHMRRPKDSTSFTLNQIKRDKLKLVKTTGKKNTFVSLPSNTTLTTTPNQTFSPSPTTPSRSIPTTTTTISSSILLKVKTYSRVSMGLLLRLVSIQKSCLIC